MAPYVLGKLRAFEDLSRYTGLQIVKLSQSIKTINLQLK